MADANPEDWTNVTIDEAIPKDPRFEDKLDAAAWSRVRGYVLTLAKEARP